LETSRTKHDLFEGLCFQKTLRLWQGYPIRHFVGLFFLSFLQASQNPRDCGKHIGEPNKEYPKGRNDRIGYDKNGIPDEAKKVMEEEGNFLHLDQ
jgi:hypothetical protein